MSDRSFGQNPGAVFQVVVPGSAVPGSVRALWFYSSLSQLIADD